MNQRLAHAFTSPFGRFCDRHGIRKEERELMHKLERFPEPDLDPDLATFHEWQATELPLDPPLAPATTREAVLHQIVTNYQEVR